LLIAIALASADAAFYAAQSKADDIKSTFYQPSLERDAEGDAYVPLRVAVAAQPIHAAEYSPITTAVPTAGDGSFRRAFANEQLNSRLAQTVPAGVWRPRWRTELEAGLDPAFILSAAGSIVVEGSDAWSLFTTAGAYVASVTLGPGNIVVGVDGNTFYHPDALGRIVARASTDGDIQFRFFPMFGKGHRRSLIARMGQRMLIVSSEMPARTHYEAHTPDLTTIEIEDLGGIRVDVDRFLEDGSRPATLLSRTNPVLTALAGETLVIALPDHLYLADRELHITTDLNADFVPERISVDEAGRIYLVARTHEGRALWIVTPNGDRVMNIAVPDTMPSLIAPPIVGYDHRVYLVSDDHVRATNPDGTLAWEHLSTARIVGAVVTEDDRLLVAAGSQVANFDGRGERTLLYDVGSEQLRSPAVLSPSAEMLFATDRYLYCLAPQSPANPRP